MSNSEIAIMADSFLRESRRWRSPGRRWVLWLALVILLPVFVGTCWFSRMLVNQDFAIGYGIALSRALRYYADQHGGRLPSSFNDLVDKGYVQKDAQRGWVVSAKAIKSFDSVEPDSLRRPEWFDVAWGASLSEIDKRGWIARLERQVVEPAPGAREFAGLGAAHCSQALGRNSDAGKTP